MSYSVNLDVNDIKYFCDIDMCFKIERWISINGFPKYMVSDLGRIKSLYHKKTKRDKILKPTLSYDGYYYVSLSCGKIFKHKIHRLVALHFIPNPDNKPTVNHKKGVKIDNRAVSLEWNTISENTKHAFDNYLMFAKKGEQSSTSKLKNSDVLEIRDSKLTYDKLSKIYSVSVSLICAIKKRKKWKHV